MSVLKITIRVECTHDLCTRAVPQCRMCRVSACSYDSAAAPAAPAAAPAAAAAAAAGYSSEKVHIEKYVYRNVKKRFQV